MAEQLHASHYKLRAVSTLLKLLLQQGDLGYRQVTSSQRHVGREGPRFGLYGWQPLRAPLLELRLKLLEPGRLRHVHEKRASSEPGKIVQAYRKGRLNCGKFLERRNGSFFKIRKLPGWWNQGDVRRQADGVSAAGALMYLLLQGPHLA